MSKVVSLDIEDEDEDEDDVVDDDDGISKEYKKNECKSIKLLTQRQVIDASIRITLLFSLGRKREPNVRVRTFGVKLCLAK